MTAATDRISGRLNVPLTQNTAPVFEFNCLYSQDVRRKHKRWKDGFLKYHTFNKRVLVYDVPRNFIGDMHWVGEEDLQEGDELKLDKSGALVQVADKVGQTETDLTELRNSRNRRPEQIDPYSPSRPYSKLNPPPAAGGRQGLPLKNKSLNALLGTPRGPIGKAILPVKSPFETRYENLIQDSWNDQRPAKRPRTANASVQTSENHRSEATPTPSKSVVSPKLNSASANKKSLNSLPGLFERNTIIDLCEEEPEHFSPGHASNALELPSSPPERMVNGQLGDARSSSPYFQTQKQSHKELKPRKVSASNTPKPYQRGVKTSTETSANQRSDCEDLENVVLPESTHGHSQNASKRQNAKNQVERATGERSTVRKIPGKVLRLAATVPKRKTLFCQDQILVGSKRLTPNDDCDRPMKRAEKTQDEDDSGIRAVGETLAERLSRIDKKKGSTSRYILDAPGPAHALLNHDVSNQDHKQINCLHPDLDEDMQISREKEEHSRYIFANQNGRKPTSPPLSRDCRTQSIPISPQSDERRCRLEELPTKSSSHPHPPDERSHSIPSDNTPLEAVGDAERAASIDPSPSPEPEYPMFRNASVSGFQRESHLDAKPADSISKPFRLPRAPTKPGKPETRPGLGPWSREAFDLFTWRPPNWDEEKWCVIE